MSHVGSHRHPGILRQAFQTSWNGTRRVQREHTSGIDGQTLSEFRAQLDRNLLVLKTELRNPTGYTFSDLKPVFVTKDNGKIRVICVPTVADRVVQRAVALVMTHNARWRYVKFNGMNYGFVKGKSVKQAVHRALTLRSSRPWVYKTDISAFFDNIDRYELKLRVESTVPNASLHSLLMRAAGCEIQVLDRPTLDRVRRAGISKGRGVRQGMPLSPLFANLYLYDFDMQVISNGLTAIRYADDFIFFAKTEEECHDIDKFCRETLDRIHLQIPDLLDNTKTIIRSPAEGIDFLGSTLSPATNGTYQAVVPQKSREVIRQRILQYGDMNYLEKHQITISAFAQSMRSVIAGYYSAYSSCADIEDFLNSMNQWGNKALRTLFKDEFSVDIESLSNRQRHFLDIAR